jgi:hypothetical protein
MPTDNPVISEIVGTALIDVPGIGPIDNSNKLLGIDGIDGHEGLGGTPDVATH